MDKKNYCVIMAGGIGSRFWPLSRSAKPKQFLDILGLGRTLLQMTFDRLAKVCDKENIYVVTSNEYARQVAEQLPEIPEENILSEPARRNTAPCIAYAALKLYKKDPEANIVVSPADHLILQDDIFASNIKEGLEFTAKEDALLTLGIKPTRPETGYGYIQFIDENNGKIKRVKTFTEKPELSIAKVFVESGEFLWNSGIFIWRAKIILDAIKKYLPDIYDTFYQYFDKFNTPEEKEAVEKIYDTVRSISIDYGVMEEADNVYVLLAEFNWSDLGTWRSLYEAKKKDENKNVIIGDNVLVYDTKNSIIHMPDGKLVVVQGLENAIIVEADNMLLITKFDDEQKLRRIVNDIKLEKGEQYV